MTSQVDIDSNDIIRLVLQFLKENNLTSSMQQLQRESGVTLNTVDNVDSFLNDIRHGRWDLVLNQVGTLKLPLDKLVSENRLEHAV
jgi:WD40 repeat-containing protein SMU1